MVMVSAPGREGVPPALPLIPTLSLLAGTFLLAGAIPAAAQRQQSPLERSVRDLGVRPSLSYLLRRAETIVAGEITELESAWTDDRTGIYTTVTLRVDRRFKGGGEEVVQFRTPGGTVGDQRLMVTHAPQFRLGERTPGLPEPPARDGCRESWAVRPESGTSGWRRMARQTFFPGSRWRRGTPDRPGPSARWTNWRWPCHGWPRRHPASLDSGFAQVTVRQVVSLDPIDVGDTYDA